MTNQADFTDTMRPIIELMCSQMRMEQENEVMKAVQSIGVNVDKERLIQALTDAHRFWQEGYDACMQWKPRWISVKDALPEVGEMVLACYINPLRKDRPPRMMVGMNPQFSNNKIYLWCGGWRAITHWMPLPEPPEVEA